VKCAETSEDYYSVSVSATLKNDSIGESTQQVTESIPLPYSRCSLVWQLFYNTFVIVSSRSKFATESGG